MKLYLTGPKRRREEIKAARDVLVARGHEVLSSWIDLPPELDDTPDEQIPADSENSGGNMHMPAPDPALAALADKTGNTPRVSGGDGMRFKEPAPAMKTRKELILTTRAAQIYTEVLECDGLVAFTDAQNHTRETAYGEYGGALWLKKKIWIVGGRFAELHYYRDVPTFAGFKDFLAMLDALGERAEAEKREA